MNVVTRPQPKGQGKQSHVPMPKKLVSTGRPPAHTLTGITKEGQLEDGQKERQVF